MKVKLFIAESDAAFVDFVLSRKYQSQEEFQEHPSHYYMPYTSHPHHTREGDLIKTWFTLVLF